jgi:hypothetical protein
VAELSPADVAEAERAAAAAEAAAAAAAAAQCKRVVRPAAALLHLSLAAAAPPPWASPVASCTFKSIPLYRPLLPPYIPHPAQASGGIAVGGLPTKLAKFNATYAPTGQASGVLPCFRSATGLHLFYDDDKGNWNLNDKPDYSAAMPWLVADAGAVPLGAHTWKVWDSEAKAFAAAELTTREVAYM